MIFQPTRHHRRLAALIARERLAQHRPPPSQVFNGNGNPYSTNARQRAFWGALAELGFGIEVRQVPDCLQYPYGDGGVDFYCPAPGPAARTLKIDIKFKRSGDLWFDRADPFTNRLDIAVLARPTLPDAPWNTGIEYVGWVDGPLWKDVAVKQEWPQGTVWMVTADNLLPWHDLGFVLEPWAHG